MLTHLLLAAGVLAAAVVVVLASPTRRCARCAGQRVTRSRWDGRTIRCPRCKGTGRHPRRGARIVSAALWQLRDALTRDPERTDNAHRHL